MNKTKVFLISVIVFVLAGGGSFYLTRSLITEEVKPVEDTTKVIIDTIPYVPPVSDTCVVDTPLSENINQEEKKKTFVTDKISIKGYKEMLKKGVADYSHDKRRIAPNISVNVTNLRQGDPGLKAGIATINTNLTLNYWDDFTIVNMTYDEMGRVSRVLISPIYPQQETTENNMELNEEE